MSRNKYLASQRGFVLLELVGLIAVMLLSGGLVYLQGEALWQQYYKQQVRFMGHWLGTCGSCSIKPCLKLIM